MTLKSVGRKRYAHLAENEEEIHVDSNVPWGVRTFTLVFWRFFVNFVKFRRTPCSRWNSALGTRVFMRCTLATINILDPMGSCRWVFIIKIEWSKNK